MQRKCYCGRKNGLIKIINNDTLKTNDFFNKYGIDVNNKSILIKNDRDYHKFLAINLSFLTS